MKDLDAAYLAGLIDGEGAIGIHQTRRGFMNSELGICMTTPAPLRWAQAVTGQGGIYFRPQVRKITYKPAYFWKVVKVDKVAEILQEILPYLKVKHMEARLFLVYAYLRSIPRKSNRRNHPEAERMISELMCRWKTGTPAYEELLDLAVYLRTRIHEEELVSTGREEDPTPHDTEQG